MKTKMAKVLLVGLLCGCITATAGAATLEVGSGKTYSTIQDAVNAASGGTLVYSNQAQNVAGDEIVVYAGSYDGFTVSGNDMDLLTIKAYRDPEDCNNASERVTITSPINLNSWAEANLIQGFYVANTTGSATLQNTYLDTSDPSTYTSRYNTWKNMVVYNASSAALYGSHTWGANRYEHCTIYSCGRPGSFGYQANASIIDTVAYGCNNSFNDSEGGSSGTYLDFYRNPIFKTGYGNLGTDGTCISTDPVFASVDPANDYFLWLQTGSPCEGAASDAGNIGALPSVTYSDPNLPVDLEVGSGYPYICIQDAIDDAEQFETIIVHEGIYYENLQIDGYIGKKNLTLVADPCDHVIIKGGISLFRSSDIPNEPYGGNYIGGFTIKQVGTGVTCQTSCARNNTWENLTIYGDRVRAGFYGYYMWGSDTINHCTVYNCNQIGSYQDQYSNAVMKNSIAAFRVRMIRAGAILANRTWFFPAGAVRQFGMEVTSLSIPVSIRWIHPVRTSCVRCLVHLVSVLPMTAPIWVPNPPPIRVSPSPIGLIRKIRLVPLIPVIHITAGRSSIWARSSRIWSFLAPARSRILHGPLAIASI